MLEMTTTLQYLIVDSEVSFLPQILYKGIEMGLERSLPLVGHICMCLITANQEEIGEYEKRGGKECMTFFEYTFYRAMTTHA
jgi:hypothetical protein